MNNMYQKGDRHCSVDGKDIFGVNNVKACEDLQNSDSHLELRKSHFSILRFGPTIINWETKEVEWITPKQKFSEIYV